MGRIYDALGDGRDVLFEGACGTGKTLASLTPALEYGRETDKTVVITTNVHQQTRQFIEEASAIAQTEDLRALVFRGKASMCHIDVGYEECQALRDTTREQVELERERAELERRQRELLDASQAGESEAAEARSAVMNDLDAIEDDLSEFEDQATCEHYYRNLTADTDEFYAWLYDDVRTPDDIYAYADRQGLCGYELLKEGMDGVDLVVANYHHLLDPMIREQFFRWLGRDPEDVIAVFDEAHNVEDAAREHARRTLTENTLGQALDELEETDDPRVEAARNVIRTYRDALETTYGETMGPGTVREAEVDDQWTDLPIANEDRKDDLTLSFLRAYTGPGYREELERALELGQELDQRYEEAYKDGETTVRKECQTLQAATFLEAWFDDSDSQGMYPVISVRKKADDGQDGLGDGSAGEIYGRAELYTCIPERVTRSLFGDLHAAVLMSATLRPFEVTEDVLGLTDPETMAYGAQFPEERRRTYAVQAPALFASERDDPATQDAVTQVLEDVIRFTPGNTLAFFPSYAEAERYYHRVDTDAKRYLDEPATPANELREEFTDGENGVLFSSLWGTLTEGVSYDGDDARTVVVVGVPYPHLDDRMDAVQDAYQVAFGGEGPDADEGAGWRYAVEIPTVRKTRQALGRVVRSPTDFGARILVDRRYTRDAEIEMREYAVRGTFPPEERAEMIDVDPEKLKFGLLNFYNDLDAYDGDPPKP
ncbi:ATP-dependent DNA helicase [Halobacteria archaeon HArc-curdl5-1]|uniref:ATP-dependent DNA helicase n=2 Tax=Halapricum hydrolyticum TaxID=2979991 RepID=A0AAE3IBG0_9EURY|nr:ATP-dependent DNA helicase [Halapricum hydrolyticum]MCU4717877.1 ATP-dependent DNA helicase [Halapricum hydrolyticum]MCU4727042.1 ATP-dependent DNA helicase [Halapricum hydrolyticum]